jgi:hypothetical protein
MPHLHNTLPSKHLHTLHSHPRLHTCPQLPSRLSRHQGLHHHPGAPHHHPGHPPPPLPPHPHHARPGQGPHPPLVPRSASHAHRTTSAPLESGAAGPPVAAGHWATLASPAQATTSVLLASVWSRALRRARPSASSHAQVSSEAEGESASGKQRWEGNVVAARLQWRCCCDKPSAIMVTDANQDVAAHSYLPQLRVTLPGRCCWDHTAAAAYAACSDSSTLARQTLLACLTTSLLARPCSLPTARCPATSQPAQHPSGARPTRPRGAHLPTCAC